MEERTCSFLSGGWKSVSRNSDGFDIAIDEGVTKIKNEGFASIFVDGNITSVTLSSTVEIIGSGAFSESESLKTVILSPNLKTISENAFSDCTSLEHIDIPNSVTTIEAGAFSGCINLKSVRLPPNLGGIEPLVFDNCESLAHINIPRRVEVINYAAFKECTSLNSVTLFNSSLKRIDASAFESCSSLETVVIYTRFNTLSQEGISGLKYAFVAPDSTPCPIKHIYVWSEDIAQYQDLFSGVLSDASVEPLPQTYVDKYFKHNYIHPTMSAAHTPNLSSMDAWGYDEDKLTPREKQTNDNRSKRQFQRIPKIGGVKGLTSSKVTVRLDENDEHFDVFYGHAPVNRDAFVDNHYLSEALAESLHKAYEQHIWPYDRDKDPDAFYEEEATYWNVLDSWRKLLTSSEESSASDYDSNGETFERYTGLPPTKKRIKRAMRNFDLNML